jgi:hypothetical protein
MDNGDFAVIGTDITASCELPEWAGRSREERIVQIPRKTLLQARPDIPLT